MNRMIMIGLFVLSVFCGFAQEQKKSLVVLNKPLPVKVILPTSQQKFTANLRKAGAGLLIGSLLSGLGSIIKSNSESSSSVSTVLQLGGIGAIVYSGISLQQAANEYEKISKEAKTEIRNTSN